jgi:hypothetical protein
VRRWHWLGDGVWASAAVLICELLERDYVLYSASRNGDFCAWNFEPSETRVCENLADFFSFFFNGSFRSRKGIFFFFDGFWFSFRRP